MEVKIIIPTYFPFWFPRMLTMPEPINFNFNFVSKNDLHRILYNGKSTNLELRAIQDRNDFQPIIHKYLLFKNEIEKRINFNIPLDIWIIILENLFEISILEDNKFKKIYLKTYQIKKIFQNNYYLFPYLQFLP